MSLNCFEYSEYIISFQFFGIPGMSSGIEHLNTIIINAKLVLN